MRTDYEAAEDWLKSINLYDLAQEFSEHREAAYLDERAKIVAWLRNNNDFYAQSWVRDIEAGEHLK